jgi:hypothetical protein
MEHLYLILFLALTGSAAVLVLLAVLDWLEADRIERGDRDE